MHRRSLFTRLPALVGVAPLAVIAPFTDVRPATRRIALQQSPLAGFQYHDGERIWPRLRPGQPLTLRREADNSHDPRAVSVWWRDRKLGYVPRNENVAVATLLDAGEALEVRVVALEASRDPWRRVRFEVSVG